MDTIVYLQFFSAAVYAEARLNDIPIARAHPGEQKTVNAPVREYLLPGRNTLQLMAQPGQKSPQTAPVFDETCEVRMRLAEFGENDWLEFDGGHEFSSLFPRLDSHLMSPLVMNSEFDLPDEKGRSWSWSKAPVISLESQRSALLHYAQTLGQLFERRDGANLEPHVLTMLTEASAAYPRVGLEDRLKGFHKIFTKSRPAWKPISFDADRIVFRPAAQGRLIELQDVEGLPFLRTHTSNILRPFDDPSYAELRCLVGVHNGNMAVLR